MSTKMNSIIRLIQNKYHIRCTSWDKFWIRRISKATTRPIRQYRWFQFHSWLHPLLGIYLKLVLILSVIGANWNDDKHILFRMKNRLRIFMHNYLNSWLNNQTNFSFPNQQLIFSEKALVHCAKSNFESTIYASPYFIFQNHKYFC